MNAANETTSEEVGWGDPNKTKALQLLFNDSTWRKKKLLMETKPVNVMSKQEGRAFNRPGVTVGMFPRQKCIGTMESFQVISQSKKKIPLDVVSLV